MTTGQVVWGSPVVQLAATAARAARSEPATERQVRVVAARPVDAGPVAMGDSQGWYVPLSEYWSSEEGREHA